MQFLAHLVESSAWQGIPLIILIRFYTIAKAFLPSLISNFKSLLTIPGTTFHIMKTIPGETTLLTALLIFSSQNSVFKLLNNKDEDIFTPCNILCAASTYGLILMFGYYVVYTKLVTFDTVKELSRFDWLMLLIGSFLYSVAGPFLFFMGLQTISVPQAAIVQRMESLNFLVLSVSLLGTHTSFGIFVSASMTLLGVVISLIWDVFYGNTVSISIGVVYVLLAGYCYSVSLFLSKKYLSAVNSGVVNLTRVLLGTVLFHMLSLILGGSDSLYASELWMLMFPYGFVYIFLGQISWIHALKEVSPIIIAVGTNLLFLLTLAFSAMLLGELPNASQWVASGFILVGIGVSLLEEVMEYKRKLALQDECKLLEHEHMSK
jgi:drug/metabolite transporter (DMT)-like permease